MKDNETLVDEKFCMQRYHDSVGAIETKMKLTNTSCYCKLVTV